jgi:aspartyl/glutamyl-tRNA(Asn/Gln) amidotransferase C subunit
MKILNEVDTKDIEETSQVTGLENVVREDVVAQAHNRDLLLQQMPVLENEELVVPGVFE